MFLSFTLNIFSFVFLIYIYTIYILTSIYKFNLQNFLRKEIGYYSNWTSFLFTNYNNNNIVNHNITFTFLYQVRWDCTSQLSFLQSIVNLSYFINVLQKIQPRPKVKMFHKFIIIYLGYFPILTLCVRYVLVSK